MTMLRLAYARYHQPRRLHFLNVTARPVPAGRGGRQPTHLPTKLRAFVRALPECLFRISDERVRAALLPEAAGLPAQTLAFDAAYVLLAAAATGDVLEGLRAPTQAIAAHGAELLQLPSDDKDLAKALASVYCAPGWEDLDVATMLRWAEVVRTCAMRLSTIESRNA